MQKNNEKNSKKSTADGKSLPDSLKGLILQLKKKKLLFWPETTTETLGDNSNEKGSYDLHDDDEITPKVVTEEKATSSPEKLSPASFFKILRYNKPEWWAILIGMLSTFVVGTNVPALSVIFGELYGVQNQIL